jgi:transposase
LNEGAPIDTLDFADGDIIQPLYPYGVGVDCHSKFIEVCVFVRTGEAIRKFEGTYSTGWKDLLTAHDWARQIICTKSCPTINPDRLRYTIESTSTYHMPIIKAWGGNPCVINPALPSSTGRKTDKLDARLMAYQSMTGLWATSFIANPHVQAFRLLMKQRQDAQRLAVTITNRINNYLLRFGHTIGATGSVRGFAARGIIEDMCRDGYMYNEGMYDGLLEGRYICPDGLPDDVKLLIKSMWEEFDKQKAREAEFHKKALNKAKSMAWETKDGAIKGDELIKNLMTVPSVGEITALVWLAEVVTPRRFGIKEKLIAFCGCDPSLKISAGKVTSQTRRGGNTRLHYQLIKVAGSCINRHKEPFGQWGYALLQRHAKGGYKKACGAVARRIATAMYFINANGEPFSYDKYNFHKIEVPDVPLDEMQFSTRTRNILASNSLSTSHVITSLFITGELHKLRGLGRKSIAEVDNWIQTNKFKKRSESS